MKTKLYLTSAIALMAIETTILACSEPGNQVATPEPAATTIFDHFVNTFDNTVAYAIDTLGDAPTLFVTHEAYEATDSNHKPTFNSIEAEVFSIDQNGKVVSYGKVRSQGTAYPLSTIEGKLVLSGHHFIETYTFHGTPRSFTLVEDAYENFDEAGNVTYGYDDVLNNITLRGCDAIKFDSLMTLQDRCQPLKFNKISNL